MFKKASWFFVLGCLAAACLDEPDCYQLNNNVLGISVKSMTDFKAHAITFDGIEPVGSDLLFYQGDSVASLALPLNFYHDSTLFIITRKGTSDSLLLGYSAKVQFVSPECGERFVLGDLTVLKHTGYALDSVRLIGRTPTKAGTSTQLEIYY